MVVTVFCTLNLQHVVWDFFSIVLVVESNWLPKTFSVANQMCN